MKTERCEIAGQARNDTVRHSDESQNLIRTTERYLTKMNFDILRDAK
jgi:hypothetical protein